MLVQHCGLYTELIIDHYYFWGTVLDMYELLLLTKQLVYANLIMTI